MTKDAKYTVLAILGGFVVFGLLMGLELAGADLAGTGRKWFGFVLWTGFVFGLVAYHRRGWLVKAKPLKVFLALLTLHIVILVLYLRPVGQFPNLFFVIISPVEAALVTFVVGLLGGGVARRERPSDHPPHIKSPPDAS